MQRIVRISLNHSDTEKLKWLDENNEVEKLLHSHVSERSLSVLGKAKLMYNNQVGWFTKLEGQPILLDDIADEDEKNKIQSTLTSRLNDINIGAKQLLAMQSLTDAQKVLLNNWLQRLSSDKNVIYAVNGDPVLINSFEQAEQLAVKPISSLFGRWWLFGILALLLLGLLAVLLWFLFCSVEEKKLVSKQDESVLFEPELELSEHCIPKEQIVKNDNPSKMVVIFDNSASMNLTLMETEVEIQKYLNTDFWVMSRSEVDQYNERMTRLPTRLSTSKQVAASSLNKIQPNVDIAIVTLSQCPNAERTNFYVSDIRSLLEKYILGLTPLENNSATPLYSGVQLASQMLDGVSRDDYILIISDGEDSCSKNDICSLASNIATKQPRLKINIIDIAGTQKINCIANSTGGKVFVAKDHDKLIEQMNYVVTEMDISLPVCKK